MTLDSDKKLTRTILPVVLALAVTGLPSVPSAAVKETGGHSGVGAATRDHGTETDDDREAAAPVEMVDGAATLMLEETVQLRSGIATEALKAVAYRPEARAFARVVDLQPLLQLRANYAAAIAEKAVAEAALAASGKAYKRADRLHREEVVSSRRFEEARARWQADNARRLGAEQRLRSIRENALQRWGSPLADWVLTDHSEPFKRLLARQEVLLLVSLGTVQSLSSGIKTIAVGRNGNRRSARPARLIAPAPHTDSVSQGETYFFRSAADGFRTGMRIDAWVPVGETSLHGVLIPQSAVVWHSGKPWCYIKTGAERFTRRPLHDPVDYLDGWVVRRGFAAGENLVTVGAQMLLSEEFRRQIPDEDDD